MKLVFVILQYNVYESTIRVVESIEANTKVDYQIVIVDNCSPNDSFEQIKKRYEDQVDIHCIVTNKNLGFANGNNVGIEYANQHFKYDWLCIMNNDIYLKSVIDETLLCDWSHKEIDVVGPNIIRLDTLEHQNPLPTIQYSRGYIYKMLFIYRCYFVLNFLHLDYYLHRLAIIVLDQLNKRQSKKQSLMHEFEGQVGKVHGSVILFNQAFISRFKKPFHPDTFMYLEEDFLALRCARSGATIYYVPSLTFEHDHSQTVNKLNKTSHQKSRYIFKHNINSYLAFLNYYKSQDL